MASEHQRFWEQESFVVIGDSKGRGYPILTYEGLKKMGKKVVSLDLGGERIDGENSIQKIEDLPPSIEAAVLELSKEMTTEVLPKVASAGIRNIWIHQGTETPMALASAQTKDLRIVYGGCAVMYVNCTSYHKIHRWIWRLIGKY